MNHRELVESGDVDLVHHSMAKRFEQFFELQFERLRLPALFFFSVLSIFFAFQAIQLKPEASFQKMVPSSHPFIQVPELRE